MPLESNDLRALSQMLADAIQQSTSSALHAATIGNAQQNTTTRVSTPPVSISGYKAADYTSVQDYFTRCEWSFQLSRIAEAEYMKYILVHMGAELNNALKILVSPRVPEDLTYEEIRTTLVDHFDGKRNQYAESVKFRQVMQEKGESVADFSLRLRRAAAYCNYGSSLDRMLTEQMLYGLESSSICDEIIAKEPASFKDAYEIAQRLEASHKSAVEMKGNVSGSNPLTESMLKVGYKSSKFGDNSKRAPTRKIASNSDSLNNTKCYGCGGSHNRDNCKFRNATCYACNKKGHIAKVCKSRTAQISDEDSDSEIIQRLNKVGGFKSGKHMMEVLLNGKKVVMELDSGAPCGIISEATLKTLLGKLYIQPTSRKFTSYTGHKINVIGRVVVNVTVGHKTRKLNVYVVDGDYDALFGREWIQQFVNEIDFRRLFSSSEPVGTLKMDAPHLTPKEAQLLQDVLVNFEDIFSCSAGKLDMPPIKLHLKQDAKPVFARAREIPIALRDTYAEEIEKKIASGIYTRVEFSEWASTTHVVAKKDGRIRITGNYKPTLNPRIIVDEHPIPKPENIFNRMKGAKLFCHLDITDAYSHLQIDDDLAHALTLNTPTHGLIRPTRAVYGAANIPAIWQRTMESVLQGIPNVCNFFEDILIYAANFEELLDVLETTLNRLQKKGLKLNQSKCVFAAPAVEFFGA
ncbi:uncharacterized protein K02A2.6-like [Lucilia cuprina]|uniref:uncharacterized protein K02A2.6-like n=1 Tax=Lucilia cuprina TaxID=7375 RepID=UPI001F06727F|nr:uncharacterized protein K02A2.6-like [Lucilia cuprina]